MEKNEGNISQLQGNSTSLETEQNIEYQGSCGQDVTIQESREVIIQGSKENDTVGNRQMEQLTSVGLGTVETRNDELSIQRTDDSLRDLSITMTKVPDSGDQNQEKNHKDPSQYGMDECKGSSLGYTYQQHHKLTENEGSKPYYFPKGTIYVGPWLNGFQHGKWDLTYPGCQKVTQIFKNGFLNGYGEMYLYNDSYYKGQWKNGLMHGRGIQTYKDGSTYNGIFIENKRNGLGVFKCEEYEYDGYWEDNKCHGQGKMTHHSKGYVYEGIYNNNQEDQKYGRVLTVFSNRLLKIHDQFEKPLDKPRKTPKDFVKERVNTLANNIYSVIPTETLNKKIKISNTKSITTQKEKIEGQNQKNQRKVNSKNKGENQVNQSYSSVDPCYNTQRQFQQDGCQEIKPQRVSTRQEVNKINNQFDEQNPLISPNTIESVIETKTNKTQVPCKCNKSKCMQEYCSCFENGQTCGIQCVCVNCENTKGNEKKIKKANERVQDRREKTHQDRQTRCNCEKKGKKTGNCDKKYCICLKKGQKCSEKCGCDDGCLNGKDDDLFKDQDQKQKKR